MKIVATLRNAWYMLSIQKKYQRVSLEFKKISFITLKCH